MLFVIFKHVQINTLCVSVYVLWHDQRLKILKCAKYIVTISGYLSGRGSGKCDSGSL